MRYFININGCILFTILMAQIGGCGRVFRTSLLRRGGRGIHSAALSLCTIMADSCLDGLAVWCSPGMQETRVRCNNNALNFSVHMNPLLHFAPSYGIHWPIVYLVRSMRTYFPQKGHSCFDGLVVWCLPRVLDTCDQCSISHWGIEFSCSLEHTITVLKLHMILHIYHLSKEQRAQWFV